MDSIAVAFRKILSKANSKVSELSGSIEELLEVVEGENAKISLIWMLGEFGANLTCAPYLLEDIINEVYNEDGEEENEEERHSQKYKLNVNFQIFNFSAFDSDHQAVLQETSRDVPRAMYSHEQDKRKRKRGL